MPENIKFRSIFIEKTEVIAVVLLLPLFFVFTGLRTQVGLMNNTQSWTLCLIVILVATAGKFLGSALSAKFVGQSWRDSLILGALMNTRGLMQLVVLNIGYELGILSPELFAMMIIMALVTTFMTVPAIDLIDRILPDITLKGVLLPEVSGDGKYNILLSFGNPESGKTMLNIVNSMVRKSTANTTITTLHFSPINEMHLYDEQEFEEESFHPMTIEAEHLHLPIKRIFKPTQDLSHSIIDTANKGNYNLLIIGIGRSVFKGSLLGKILGISTKIMNPEILIDTIRGKDTFMDETVLDDKVRRITRKTRIPVGILVDRGLKKVRRILVLVSSASDHFLLSYAHRFIANNESPVALIDTGDIINQNKDLTDTIKTIDRQYPGFITVYSPNSSDTLKFEEYDLMLVNFRSWEKPNKNNNIWINSPVSALIIRQ